MLLAAVVVAGIFASALYMGGRSDVTVSVASDGKPVVVQGADGKDGQIVFGGAPSETTNWTSGAFSDDLSVGDDLTVTGDATVGGTFGSTGTITATGGLIVGAGTEVDLWKAVTSTINADNIENGSVTTSAVTFTGASIGDFVGVGLTGDWSGASSSVAVRGSVTASNVVTVYWQNTSSTAVDLSRTQLNIQLVNN